MEANTIDGIYKNLSRLETILFPHSTSSHSTSSHSAIPSQLSTLLLLLPLTTFSRDPISGMSKSNASYDRSQPSTIAPTSGTVLVFVTTFDDPDRPGKSCHFFNATSDLEASQISEDPSARGMAQYLQGSEIGAGTMDLDRLHNYILSAFGEYEEGNPSIHFSLTTKGDPSIPEDFNLVELDQCAGNGEEDCKQTETQESNVSVGDLMYVMADMQYEEDVKMGGT
jgi:hypothetical protein